MKVKLSFNGVTVSTHVERIQAQYYKGENKPKSVHVMLDGVSACAELFIDNPSERQLEAFGFYKYEDSNEQSDRTEHQGER